jgi:hypothetical protein
MKRQHLDFSTQIKKKIRKKTRYRCESCGNNFDEKFQGDFHHIFSLFHGDDSTEKNCSLLCHDCHLVAPNIKSPENLSIYRSYFLRFTSFKEGAQYYGVNTRLELYV